MAILQVYNSGTDTGQLKENQGSKVFVRFLSGFTHSEQLTSAEMILAQCISSNWKYFL